jgi:uncharacterized RDD family membrane protein YckC
MSSFAPAAEPPQACPLCGKAKKMGKKAQLLYGHLVCQKCYYAFANRRQLAFFLDAVGWDCTVLVIGMLLGITMAAAGSRPSEIEVAGNILGWLLLPVFFCKDCFWGHSLGKAICGVRVIDETTGAPGGIVASFKRNLPLLIPFMPLVVAFQLCKGHRIGDGWSGTKVVWKKFANHPIFAATALPR